MAQEVRVDIWCDGLKLGGDGDFVVRHDPRVEAFTRPPIALDGKAPKHVDLCDLCNSELTLDELREVLKQFGVVPAGKGPSSRPGQAASSPAREVAHNALNGARAGRDRGAGVKTFVCIWCPLDYSQSGWLSHIQKKHGFSGIKEAVGHQCPVCGTDGFDTLSVHISRTHDEFDSITDAFHWAKDNGDPYGVWAKQRDAGQNVVEAML